MNCPMCRGIVTEDPVFVCVEAGKEEEEQDCVERWEGEQAFLLMTALEENPDMEHLIRSHSLFLRSDEN